MIVRLNKEKIFLIIGFIFLIAVVAWYFQNSAMPPDEGVVPGRAKGYFPEEMKGPLVSREYEAPAVRKSPFLPTSTGAGEDIQIDLPLPAIRIKSPLLTMVSPLPPVFQNVNKLFRLSQAASKSAGLILPPVAALLSTDAIVEMIEGIAPIEEEMPPKIDPDYRGDDTVIMQSGEVRTGRIVKERYTDKEGKQWMTFTPKTWKQSMEIAWLDIRQATSYKTIREEFQEKLGNTASDNADAQYQLALWCFEKGMDEEAVKCLERAINAGKTEIKYYFRLAEYYASQMNMEKELSVYQSALKSGVVNTEVLFEKLGGVSERLGMPVEALAYYEDSTKAHPHYVPAWLRMGDLYFARGNYDAALNCYQRVQQINAGEPALPSRMGTLEFMKGNFPQAGQLLGKEPGFANMLGVIALLSDDHQTAVQHFSEAIKNSLKDRAAGLTNLAYLYLAADKHKDAELLLQEAAKQDPASAMPLIGLGYLRWMTNNHDDALQQFNKAVKIDPANFFAYYSRGQFHFYKRKNDLAQKDFLFCLDNNPSFPGILYHLGVIAFEDKKFADAMNYYTLYTRQIPDISVDDYVNLGIIYAADRQFEKSFAAVAQATALKPEYLPVLSLQAYLLFMANNNSKEAIELLAQLTKKYPDEDYIYEILNLINRAASLVKWTDKFDRPNNADIGKVWTEIEKFGVVISLTDKKCVFSGKQAVVNQAITSLEQIRSKDNFAELEIEFESVKDKSDKVTGFYIADQNKRSMLFIANVNNQLCYGSSKSADKPPSEWTPFKKNIQIATDNYKIALKRIKDTVSGKETEEFKCFYDKELVDTIPAKELSFFRAQGASIIIGIFGYAPLNRKWELAVKNVTLLEERAR
jgi:tetratricopeptide (TPR) repeat protein